MSDCGRNFRERNKYEIALEHARVGNLKLWRFDGGIAIEKDVQIDEAGPFDEGFLAAHLGFDGAEAGEELRWRELGLCFEGAVEKPRLIEIVDRLSFIKGRYFRYLQTGFAQQANGFAKIFFAVANIGTERQVNGGHTGFILCRTGGRTCQSWSVPPGVS